MSIATFIAGLVLGVGGTLYMLNRNPERLRAWAAKIEGKIRAKL